MIAWFWRAARRSRGPALIVALSASLITLTWQGVQLWQTLRDTSLIADLASGVDAVPGKNAPAAVLLARANYLLGQSRLEEAQDLGDESALRETPAIHAAIYYNLANARLRNALSMISRQQTDRALSMIGLASEEYRQALRLSPDDWNIRYNFDAAMRMVRDAPRLQLEQEGELERQPSRKQNWTDLPSMAKGLP